MIFLAAFRVHHGQGGIGPKFVFQELRISRFLFKETIYTYTHVVRAREIKEGSKTAARLH